MIALVQKDLKQSAVPLPTTISLDPKVKVRLAEACEIKNHRSWSQAIDQLLDRLEGYEANLKIRGEVKKR